MGRPTRTRWSITRFPRLLLERTSGGGDPNLPFPRKKRKSKFGHSIYLTDDWLFAACQNLGILYRLNFCWTKNHRHTQSCLESESSPRWPLPGRLLRCLLASGNCSGTSPAPKEQASITSFAVSFLLPAAALSWLLIVTHFTH